ncbi:hypothetical protein ZTR_08078 [Talaromyces verruculosus]|nr:hypothetical protein ZTR_08078 [Talaromyces verruculosus]
MTMDQLADELREQRNLLERLSKEFREHRKVSERLLNKVEEQQIVIDRIANRVREQREVSEQNFKTLKKWWFLYRAAQIEFAGTQQRWDDESREFYRRSRNPRVPGAEYPKDEIKDKFEKPASFRSRYDLMSSLWFDGLPAFFAQYFGAFTGWIPPFDLILIHFYNAILFKRFTITSSAARPDSALINYVWQNVFAKEDMIVDSEAMRVGNREGLDWMERMERETQAQRNIIDQLREDSKMQKIINEQQKRMWFEVRATEIEKHGHSQAEEVMLARSERNQTVHGGDIIQDLEVVDFMKAKTTQQRHDSLQAAFEAWYEVSLRYKHQIVHAPELVVKTFNTLADTKSRWGWSSNPTTQDEVQKICRGIISRWLEYVNRAKGEYPEDDIRREFDKLVTLRSA